MGPLVTQAKAILASSRRTAQLARSRISDSRERLSQSEDTVVATASRITEARFTLGGGISARSPARACNSRKDSN